MDGTESWGILYDESVRKVKRATPPLSPSRARYLAELALREIDGRRNVGRADVLDVLERDRHKVFTPYRRWFQEIAVHATRIVNGEPRPVDDDRSPTGVERARRETMGTGGQATKKVPYSRWLQYRSFIDRLRSHDAGGYSWNSLSCDVLGVSSAGFARKAYEARPILREAHVARIEEEVKTLPKAPDPSPRMSASERRNRVVSVIDQMRVSPYELEPEEIAKKLGLSRQRLETMAFGTNGESAPRAEDVSNIETAWEGIRDGVEIYEEIAERELKDDRLERWKRAARYLKEKNDLTWRQVWALQDYYTTDKSMMAMHSSFTRKETAVSPDGLEAIEEAVERFKGGERPWEKKTVETEEPAAIETEEPAAIETEEPAAIEEEEQDPADHAVELLGLSILALKDARDRAKPHFYKTAMDVAIAQVRDVTMYLAGEEAGKDI